MISLIGLGEREIPEGTKWGVAWDGEAHAYDVLFELHDKSRYRLRPRYIEKLQEFTQPIMMQQPDPEVPASVEYPLQRVIDVTGDYFGSSVAFMLGLAMLEDDDIHMHGFELYDDDGYEHQRPNIEYLIGLARGRGVNVTVHGGALLTHRPDLLSLGEPIVYPVRYGWL